MKDNISINRRKFLLGSLLIPIANLPLRAFAQPLPRVDERDPSAAAVGFKHNVANIDSMMFPSRSLAADGANQFCNNCVLYTELDEEWGGCALFPDRSVASEGWCTVWSQKAE